MLERQRKWQRENKDKLAEYGRRRRARHPEKLADYNKQWHARNPGYSATQSKKWAEANPERRKELVAKSDKKNQHKKTAREAQRRARMSGSPADPRINEIYKQARALRASGIDVHVDHVIPLARGGAHVFGNLQILPAAENLRKGSKLPKEK